tara:strand:+ start:1793 stop:2095 length:303 start_codon:yes stop_codon:yes gene_type:complete
MSLINVDLSDTIASWRSKTNQLGSNLGDLALLTTSVDSDIVGAINSLKAADSASITALDSDIGTLASLTTTDKSDIVSAVNELDRRSIDVFNAAGVLLNS